MDTIDAFLAGVEPGGLRDSAQIIVLIGHLLTSCDQPLTREQLFAVICDSGLANYFSAGQALDELTTRGNVTVEEGGALRMTEAGRFAVTALEGDLPLSVREKALQTAEKLQTLERRVSENKIEVTARADGFDVSFTLNDNGDTLMRLTMFVADAAQVETVRRNFLKDPAKLYSGIIEALS